jgi:hypothetical protein
LQQVDLVRHDRSPCGREVRAEGVLEIRRGRDGNGVLSPGRPFLFHA